MNTVNITLPATAVKAIEDLEARKKILLSVFKTTEERHDMVRRRNRPELCDEVPCGLGDGTSGIVAAIKEIDNAIAKIVTRCLVDRNW